jgi:uncharacterized protein
MSPRSLALPPLRAWSAQVDRVWLASATILLTLFVLVPAQGQASLAFAAASLLEVLPYLLASILVAAYAQASGADGLIARAFQGHIALMVLFAALMGALSPFCSCGVIPLIAALLAMGVPLAAVMAFWLASPIMDPSMFVLTAGVLGADFAIAKTVAAIGLGLFGGFAITAFQRTGWFERPLRDGVGEGGCAGAKLRRPNAVSWRFWHEPARVASFARGARSNLLFLGKWLTLAFVLESLMLAYVPAELIAQAVGQGGWLPVLGAALVGVPAYLNGYAALPLVGGLIEQGMAPGAAMAFLVAGGVTSIPAAIAVFALARLPVFLTYLAFALIGATAAGVAFGLVA